ncbi:MAG: ATP-binding protein, partial [Thermosynechococcaceae cyanobacterium]
QTIQKFLAITKGEWQGELEQVTQSNQSIIVESRWTIMRDEQGNLKSIFIVNTDITAKKQLELQLLHHQRLESLDRLASGIAHDLNNILTPMLVISKLLPLYFSTVDDTAIRLLEILDINVKRASELIQQIKLFSGVSKEKKTDLQIGLLISDIVKMAESVFPKSIALYTEIDPELRCVKGNSIQLHQVLLNLCINARDAMPDGGILSLFAKNMVVDHNNIQMYPKAQYGPYLVITISDTGVGISAEIVSRIFDPFFTTKPEGQGIGLSIVAGIVKDHHGFITVSSRVERGTQFQIFLPALDTTDISLEESLNIPLGNTELILLVDDEIMILETTKILLEQSGYQVLTAQNGIQAISLYQQHKDEIRTIILDMMMPSMDGQTAILGLKAINENVKIIVNSGLRSSYQFDSEYDTNIRACLSKPYRLETLLMTVREVIDSQSESV